MKHGRTTRLLLALAFAVGQWFAVVHGTQHELSNTDKLVACEICVAGQASGTAPAAAAAALTLLPASEAPVVDPVAAALSKPQYRPPSRGPPSILV